MKPVIAILLASNLLAQIPAPPKLSDPFRKYDVIEFAMPNERGAPKSQPEKFVVMRAQPLFERMMDQMNREAAECEASKPNPNPKPRKPGQYLISDFTSYRSTLTISSIGQGEVSISPCGKLELSGGMTMEQGLRLAMRLIADDSHYCEQRVSDVITGYKKIIEAYEEYRREINKLLQPHMGPDKPPLAGRKKG